MWLWTEQVNHIILDFQYYRQFLQKAMNLIKTYAYHSLTLRKLMIQSIDLVLKI